jgi:uncharacterized protein (DUF983 family)
VELKEEIIMNKRIVLLAGLIIFGVYMVIDKFITPIALWISVPLLIISIVMILYGGLKPKDSIDKEKET